MKLNAHMETKVDLPGMKGETLHEAIKECVGCVCCGYYMDKIKKVENTWSSYAGSLRYEYDAGELYR